MERLRLPDWLFSERAYYWTSIAILFLGLGLRLLHLDKGIWLDEFLSLRRVFSEDFLHQLRSSNHPPLYFVLLRLWYQINPSEPFLRLLSVFFGIATVAVVMKWMKPYSPPGSLLAGLYCATLPLMLRYSQEIRGYALLLFATALSFLFASRIAAQPEKRSGYIALSLSLTAAVATHAIGVMIPLSICLFLALTPLALTPARVKRVLFAMSLPAFAFIGLFFLFLPEAQREPTTWWMPSISPHILLSTAKSLFGLDETDWFSKAIHSAIPILPGGTGVALEIAALALAVGLLLLGSWKHSLPWLAAALFYWMQMIAYSIFVLPILRDRTALAGMIPFIGFLGLQIATIQGKKLRILSVIALFSLCMVFSIGWINKTRHPSAHWREISQSLISAWQPGDTAIASRPSIQGILRYYTKLPSEAFVSIRVEGDTDKVQAKIRRRVVGKKDQTGPLRVFVIIRHDKRAKKHPDQYRRFMSFLQTEFGQPSFLRKAGDLSLRGYDLHGGESR